MKSVFLLAKAKERRKGTAKLQRNSSKLQWVTTSMIKTAGNYDKLNLEYKLESLNLKAIKIELVSLYVLDILELKFKGINKLKVKSSFTDFLKKRKENGKEDRRRAKMWRNYNEL